MATAANTKDGGVAVTFTEDEVDALLHATRGSILHDVHTAVKALEDEKATKATKAAKSES